MEKNSDSAALNFGELVVESVPEGLNFGRRNGGGKFGLCMAHLACGYCPIETDTTYQAKL